MKMQKNTRPETYGYFCLHTSSGRYSLSFHESPNITSINEFRGITRTVHIHPIHCLDEEAPKLKKILNQLNRGEIKEGDLIKRLWESC